MPRWLRDLILPLAVLLGLPLGMLGPALALPALVYGFPLLLLGLLAGLAALVLRGWRRERAPERVPERVSQDVRAGRPTRTASLDDRPYAALPITPPPGAPSPLAAVRVTLNAEENGRLDSRALASAEPLAGGPFRRLLVLLDPVDFAPEALARAVATARRDGAEIILASVIDVEEARRRGTARASLAHHPIVLRAMLDKELENLCWGIQASGVNVRRRAELDDPARRVPELARDLGADAVVVAPRRPRLLRARPSPPAWAQAAPCPVLALGD